MCLSDLFVKLDGLCFIFFLLGSNTSVLIENSVGNF